MSYRVGGHNRLTKKNNPTVIKPSQELLSSLNVAPHVLVLRAQ
jgi:hypothetical protein